MAKELKIRITGDSSGLRSATDDGVGILEGFSAKVSALSVAAGNLLADGIKRGFGAISGFAKDSVGAASDLNETISKVGVLFGEAAPQIEKFAGTAAKSFGQSQQQAMDAAATFATFGKSAGLTGNDLATFSTDLVGLASDMASFGNTTPDDAIQAIGAALRGEAEPIRRYGVLLDDASMRQQALEMGIISNTKNALTPQQKVLAAQALIFKQTAAAQGDFARTSDGLANKQRILSAQIANLKTSVGQAFLPVVLAATAALSDKLLPVLEKFGPLIATELAGGIQAFGSAFRAFDGDVTSSGFPGFMERVAYYARLGWEAFKDLLPTLKDFADVVTGKAQDGLAFVSAHMDTIRNAVEKIGPPLGVALAAFLGFQQLKTAASPLLSMAQSIIAIGGFLLANPVALAVAALAGAFYLAYTRSQTFRDAVDALVQRFLGFVQSVRAAFERGGMSEAFTVAVDGIKSALGDLLDWLQATALPWLKDQAGKLAVILGGWIIEAGQYLRENLPGWLGELTEWLVGTALPAVIIATGKLAFALSNWVNDAIDDLIRNLPGWLIKAVPALMRFGDDIAKSIIDGLISGLWQMAGKLSSALLDFVEENIPGVIRKALGISSPSKVFAGFGRNIAQGLALGMTNGADMVASAAGGLALAATPSFDAVGTGSFATMSASAFTPAGAGVAGGAPMVINITTGADPQAVVTAIKTYARQNGGVPW